MSQQILVIGLIVGVVIVGIGFAVCVLSMTGGSDEEEAREQREFFLRPFSYVNRSWNRSFRRFGYGMIIFMIGGIIAAGCFYALGFHYADNVINRFFEILEGNKP